MSPMWESVNKYASEVSGWLLGGPILRTIPPLSTECRSVGRRAEDYSSLRDALENSYFSTCNTHENQHDLFCRGLSDLKDLVGGGACDGIGQSIR